MKNLVFNLRTAKAQAEGCAKVTKSSRMAKVLTTLTLLLTLGVGQMWGYVNGSAYLYFNPDGKWSYTKYYFAAIQEHGSWQTKVYELSKISHTNLYYLSTTEWNDADYITFGAQNGNFSGGYWGYDSFKSYITMCGEKCNWGLDYTKTYTFKPSANTKGTSINPSYHSGGYSDLNHDQTVYKYTSNGGTSAASYTAQSVASGTVTISAYKMTGNGTASNSSNSGTISAASTTYLSKKAAYTGEVTLTASPNANYIFEGWYESTSATTPLSTDLEYTYNAPNSTKSVYARFRYEQTYTITIANNKTAATTTQQVGATTPITITAPSVTDHVFSTWEAMPANVTKYSGNLTDESIQIRATAAATVTADFNLIPCSIVYKFGSGQSNEIFNRGGSSVTTAAMTYDITSNAYYKDVTVSGTQLNFRFYYNGSKEYATSWNGDYPNIYSVTINGDQRDCNTEVQGWTNKSSIKVTYASGTTSLRVWYSKQTGKAWVTETTYSVSVASENTNRGTVNKSSVTAGRNTASASFTATPVSNSGWMFKQWSATSPASLVSSATTNPNTVKATSTGGSVQAQFKHRYILRGSTNADNSELGGMAGWDATDNSAYATASISDGVMTITANLTKAKTKYKFKIYDLSADNWKGQTGSSDIPDNTSWTLNGSNNVTLTTTAAGTYTFIYTVSSNSIKVLFPSPVYSVTYGVQSGTGTVTAKIGTESIGASPGKAVGGANVVMTASDGTGYQFSKWVNESGTQISTSNPYTISSIAANCTIKAVFTARNYTAANNLKEADGTANGQYNVTYDNTSIAHTSAPSRTGYTVEGYYKQAAWTNKIANTNLSLVASTDYATSASKWKVTSAPNLYIKWQQTLTLAGNGAGSTNGSVTTTYLGTASSHTAATRTGYRLNGYYDNTSGGNKILTNTGALVTYSASVSSYINSAGKWIYNGTPTLSAQWTAEIYTITFAPNGGTVTPTSRSVTYDAAITNAPVPEKTGYNFTGYNTSGGASITTNTGVFKASVDGFTDGSAHWVKASGATITAQWSPKTYTITLTQSSETGYGSSGTANVTATYDAALPTIASLPTAAQGYAFMGYYTGHNGTGTQYYGPTGNKLVATYTTAGGIELFAYFKKAEITNLTFDAAVVAPSTPVGVTPTVAPTPTGTNSICWKLLYNNGNLYDPQPTFSPANPGGVDNKVTFNAPPSSGMYLVAAVLRTGSNCDGGTKLDSVAYQFQVAGNHTVTVQYKCGDVTIKASTTTTGRPLNWSDEITPPEIFGYTFSKWKAGDGVTMTIDGGETTIGTGGETTGKATTHAVQIKANYDGKLIAIYTKKSIIYFKNTLGWDKVYVNIMNNQYWDVYNGSGNSNNYYARNQEMSLVDGTDDIYYLEYSGSTSVYMSFTSMSQTNATNFWATTANNLRVVYPTHPFDDQGEQTSYGFNAGTPMFVPTAGQTPVDKNINATGKASYYNKGHWRKYDPIQGETGYTLKVYNKTEDDGRTELKSIKFVESDVPGQLFKAVANLEAAEGYGIKFERDNSMLYTNTTGHLQRTGDVVVTEKGDANYKAIWIRATAAGDYTFAITINGDGKLCIQAEFPVVKNDYRVIYTDNDTWTKAHTAQSWTHSSRIINAVANAVDTISFFVSKGHSPEFKIQKVNAINETTGAITWTDVTSWTSCNDVAASGVYNFIFTQNGSKEISFTKKEAYTGNYYIRTNCAGSSKWDNYRDNSDHLMTYTEYSIDHGGYSHYYCHWIESADANRKNIKFCIANDYSPCISDTLTRETASGEWANIGSFIEPNGDLKRNANVRFMWNQSTNKISRAYLDPAKGDDNFLVLASADDKIANESEVVQTSVVFSDNENWIYEANVKAKANAQIKLVATWGDAPTTIVQYFKGTDESTETLITGDPEDLKWYDIRLIYDYKTNRLIAALLPSGNIEDPKPINADVMFIREHQGDISQVTFTDDGKLTDIKIAYGVMRFSKWTLNNKDKSTHLPLDDPKSYYERALYFISFPFEVKLSEVFGFGTYAQDWIIEYYDGAERARTGWWEGQPGFWRYVWDRKNFVLEPNKGYLLELELGNFNEESGFWSNDNERLELFFPSSGNLGTITNTTVNCSIPEHACTINRAATEGLPDTPNNPHTSYNRTIFDSHWNVMSVPTYVNATPNAWDNTTWTAKIGPKFLYTWNMDDNTLTATSGSRFTYHAMHAYMVQYGGNVQWVTSGTGPAAIVARNTYAEQPKEVEFRLEIQQNEKMVDQTFVIMSNDDQINANFQFGEDMSKDFNARNANIYTMTADNVAAAGNSLPMSETTTIVPVGVSVKKTGDYTFSIPDGTNGVGITLIDEETGIRTSLSALDYAVELAAGDYTERFWLEISPVKGTETGIEPGVNEHDAKIRKVMIDGILYIIRDGKMYDARGARVE